MRHIVGRGEAGNCRRERRGQPHCGEVRRRVDRGDDARDPGAAGKRVDGDLGIDGAGADVLEHMCRGGDEAGGDLKARADGLAAGVEHAPQIHRHAPIGRLVGHAFAALYVSFTRSVASPVAPATMMLPFAETLSPNSTSSWSGRTLRSAV